MFYILSCNKNDSVPPSWRLSSAQVLNAVILCGNCLGWSTLDVQFWIEDDSYFMMQQSLTFSNSMPQRAPRPWLPSTATFRWLADKQCKSIQIYHPAPFWEVRSTDNHAESCWMLTWGASCVSTPACLSLYSQEANFQANTRKKKCLWRSMTTMPKSQKFKTQILAYWSVQILWFPLLISQGIVFLSSNSSFNFEIKKWTQVRSFLAARWPKQRKSTTLWKDVESKTYCTEFPPLSNL